MRQRPTQEGFQLVEVIVALALAGLAAALLVPALGRLSTGLRVGLAAGEVAGALQMAKAWAVRHSANAGLKFRDEPGGLTTFTLYRDGDGDGVRTADIDSGVDPQVAPSRTLLHLGRQISFGFPPGPAPVDPGDPTRRLDDLEDPIRFGASDIASFSPLGGSTPGSIYVTDQVFHLAVVRVLGATGRVKVLTYDSLEERWR